MKNIKLIFQAATVFIGTIVGAGLASGQEITQFFSTYGFSGFYGILICGVFYIVISSIIVSISLHHNLNSYTDFINLVSPGFFGKITDYLTSFFLISGAAIIMAGSGALLYQHFGIPRIVGTLLMLVIAMFTLLKDTKGLIAINSMIVPTLTTIICTIFALHLIFAPDAMSIESMKAAPIYKELIIDKQWIFACFLYAGFNMLSCSGVIVPICKEIKSKSILISGLIIGALMLTFLGALINAMLIANSPDIFNYEIPLLFVASKFTRLIQILLLCIIWCEMFSTEVSDIYSVGKTLEIKYNIPYKKSVVCLLLIALPISQIGFKKLITFLYPGFGIISIIFLLQCIVFYVKMKKKPC
ncbi:YkvI family membrane protein [Clostridium culturomicium]|uniref:YkvI family membrane protein n=1 Tax=Clostridium culturomicium TaxID=1499683 RepID=UPI00058B8780|nr:transporter [Clostridium culturomicium]